MVNNIAPQADHACPVDEYIVQDIVLGYQLPVPATPTFVIHYKGQGLILPTPAAVSWPILKQFFDSLLSLNRRFRPIGRTMRVSCRNREGKPEDNSGAGQNPNLFCIQRRKDSAPRGFQSCRCSLRCRAERVRHPPDVADLFGLGP